MFDLQEENHDKRLDFVPENRKTDGITRFVKRDYMLSSYFSYFIRIFSFSSGKIQQGKENLQYNDIKSHICK